jgi:hypothetical protein
MSDDCCTYFISNPATHEGRHPSTSLRQVVALACPGMLESPLVDAKNGMSVQLGLVKYAGF